MNAKVTNAPAYRSLLNQLTPEAKTTVEKLGLAFDQALEDGQLAKGEAFVLGFIRDPLKSSGFDEELNVAGRLLGDPTIGSSKH